MRYATVCSGTEAFGPHWHRLGFRCAFHAEIANHPSAVLRYRYPHVPNYGDFTQLQASAAARLELLAGGTPCQDFSLAGLRAGAHGDKGNLTLEFLLLLKRLGPRWVVWENVPGTFSSVSHAAPDSSPPPIDLAGDDGPADGTEIVVEDEYDADESHAFAVFLAGLSELGYGVAYRVLDAQHAGVPQRRRRIQLVGYSGNLGRRAHAATLSERAGFSSVSAAVLFESHSLRGHSAPGREAGEKVAGTLTACTGGSGPAGRLELAATGYLQITGTLTAGGKSAGSVTQQDAENGLLVVSNAEGTEGLPYLTASNLSKQANNQQPLVYQCHGNNVGELGTLRTRQGVQNGVPFTTAEPLAFALRGREEGAVPEIHAEGATVGALRSAGGGSSRDYVVQPGAPAPEPVAFDTTQITSRANGSNPQPGDPCHCLPASGHAPAVAFGWNKSAAQSMSVREVTDPLLAAPSSQPAVFDPAERLHYGPAQQDRIHFPQGHMGTLAAGTHHNGGSYTKTFVGGAVRRLTPRECERLMGWADDWTRWGLRAGTPPALLAALAAAWATDDEQPLAEVRAALLAGRWLYEVADGPRYEMCGNGWAAPDFEWLGERILLVEQLLQEQGGYSPSWPNSPAPLP